jgi:hypothetical protein
MNQTRLDSYNKHCSQTQGTLVANWWEERELREATGIGRTIHEHHIEKKH